MRSIITPLTPVECSTIELADSSTMALVILEGSFVYISSFQPNLPMARAHVLRECTNILIYRLPLHWCKLVQAVLNECQVCSIHTVAESLRHFESIVDAELWCNIIAVLKLSTCVCNGTCVAISIAEVLLKVDIRVIEALVQAVVGLQHSLLVLFISVVQQA